MLCLWTALMKEDSLYIDSCSYSLPVFSTSRFLHIYSFFLLCFGHFFVLVALQNACTILCKCLHSVILSDGFPSTKHFSMMKKTHHRKELGRNQLWIWHCLCKLCAQYSSLWDAEKEIGTFSLFDKFLHISDCSSLLGTSLFQTTGLISFKMITIHFGSPPDQTGYMPTWASPLCIPPTCTIPHGPSHQALHRGGTVWLVGVAFLNCPPTKTHHFNCPFCWCEIQ